MRLVLTYTLNIPKLLSAVLGVALVLIRDVHLDSITGSQYRSAWDRNSPQALNFYASIHLHLYVYMYIHVYMYACIFIAKSLELRQSW